METFSAVRAGALPASSGGTIARVRLPAGLHVSPDSSLSSVADPVLWISREPVRDMWPLWSAVATEFHDHGLWPLVLDSLGDRPWLCGELEPVPTSRADGHDARAVLAKLWGDVTEGPEDPDALDALLAPFDPRWPGMANATAGAVEPRALEEAVKAQEGRLGLVGCTRPAEALAAVGWRGTLNHYEIDELCSVLRSWEERFRAFLVGVGFDTITVAVERPPRDIDEAMLVAAEHFAVCPDVVAQDDDDTIEESANRLVGARAWRFWWD